MEKAGSLLLRLLIGCALLGRVLGAGVPALPVPPAPQPRRRVPGLLAVLALSGALAIGGVVAYVRAGRPMPSPKRPEGGLVLLLAGSAPPTWKTNYDTLLVDIARPKSSAPEVTLSAHVEHPTVAIVSGAMRPDGPVHEVGVRSAFSTFALREVVNARGYYGDEEPPETSTLGSYDEVGEHRALASVAGLERSTAVAITLDGFETYTWKLSGPVAVSGQGAEVGALPPIGTPIDGASGALVRFSAGDFGVPRLRRADEAEVQSVNAHRSTEAAPDATSQRDWVELRGPDYDTDAVVPTGLRTIVSVDAPARSRPDAIAPAATLTGDKMVWTAPTRQGQVPATTWYWSDPKQAQDTAMALFYAALLAGIAGGLLLWFLPPRS